MPTVGLDDVALSHVQGHVSRVKIEGTFNTATGILLERIFCRGLLLALVTKTMKVLFDCTYAFLLGSFLFSGDRGHTRVKRADLSTSVLFDP